MQPVAAFSEAWRRNEADIARWVKRQSTLPGMDATQSLLLGDIQADMADYLRSKMNLPDDVAQERIIARGLDRLRSAMMTADVATARRAWARTGQEAQVYVEDDRHQGVRDERFDHLRSIGAAEWKWKARLDRRSCAYCIVRHGTVHPITTPLVSHPNCRCMPVVATTKLVLGTDWLRSRSPHTLRRILGRRRAQMVVYEGADPVAMVNMDKGRLFPLREIDRGQLAQLSDEVPSIDVRLTAPKKSKAGIAARVRGKTKLGALDDWTLGYGDRKTLEGEGFTERLQPTKLSKRAVKMEVHLEDSGLTDDEKADATKFMQETATAILKDLDESFKYGTTWNGRIDVIDPAVPGILRGVNGVKIWNCAIYLNPSLFRDAARNRGWTDNVMGADAQVFHTMYHEFLHSFSRAYLKQNFADNRWLEEGTVDLLTRDWGGELFKALHPERSKVWDDHVESHARFHPYTGAVVRLERIAELTDDNVHDICGALMSTPLPDRYETLKNAIMEAPEGVSDDAVADALELLEDLREGPSYLTGEWPVVRF